MTTRRHSPRSQVFQRLGIRTVGQLRRWPLSVLRARFGSGGEDLWQLAHGIDDRPVVPERATKSISHETTFEKDVADMEVWQAWLVELVEQVGRRLRRHARWRESCMSYRAALASQTIDNETAFSEDRV